MHHLLVAAAYGAILLGPVVLALQKDDLAAAWQAMLGRDSAARDAAAARRGAPSSADAADTPRQQSARREPRKARPIRHFRKANQVAVAEHVRRAEEAAAYARFTAWLNTQAEQTRRHASDTGLPAATMTGSAATLGLPVPATLFYEDVDLIQRLADARQGIVREAVATASSRSRTQARSSLQAYRRAEQVPRPDETMRPEQRLRAEPWLQAGRRPAIQNRDLDARYRDADAWTRNTDAQHSDTQAA